MLHALCSLQRSHDRSLQRPVRRHWQKLRGKDSESKLLKRRIVVSGSSHAAAPRVTLTSRSSCQCLGHGHVRLRASWPSAAASFRLGAETRPACATPGHTDRRLRSSLGARNLLYLVKVQSDNSPRLQVDYREGARTSQDRCSASVSDVRRAARALPPSGQWLGVIRRLAGVGIYRGVFGHRYSA